MWLVPWSPFSLTTWLECHLFMHRCRSVSCGWGEEVSVCVSLLLQSFFLDRLACTALAVQAVLL